jgi:hypothetical protein
MNASNYARGGEAHVHSVYLKATRPFVVRFNEDMVPFHADQRLDIDDNVDIVKYAKRNGYDSVHFPDGNFSESGNTWVVFNPEQIKSVDAKEFDEKSPLIDR